MAHRVMHILMVSIVALAVLAAGVLNGNVLCIGDDGHVAIEAPHQPSAIAKAATPPAPVQQERDGEHGPCSDIAVDVEVAVRQTAMGTLDAPTIPPVLDVDLPDVLTAVAVPAGAANPSDAVQAGTTLGRLRCVILLI